MGNGDHPYPVHRRTPPAEAARTRLDELGMRLGRWFLPKSPSKPRGRRLPPAPAVTQDRDPVPPTGSATPGF